MTLKKEISLGDIIIAIPLIIAVVAGYVHHDDAIKQHQESIAFLTANQTELAKNQNQFVIVQTKQQMILDFLSKVK